MGLRGRANLTDEISFFITTTVMNFIPVFNYDSNCKLLIDNIKHYQSKYNFLILAYVIMPTHFHWIVVIDPAKGFISDIMRDIKKYSAWNIMDNLQKINSKYKNMFNKSQRAGQRRQLWNHRFDDLVIRNEKMLWGKIKYIHNNPVQDNLVKRPEHYKYSSARNYICDDHSILFVDTKYAGINM